MSIYLQVRSTSPSSRVDTLMRLASCLDLTQWHRIETERHLSWHPTTFIAQLYSASSLYWRCNSSLTADDIKLISARSSWQCGEYITPQSYNISDPKASNIQTVGTVVTMHSEVFMGIKHACDLIQGCYHLGGFLTFCSLSRLRREPYASELTKLSTPYHTDDEYNFGCYLLTDLHFFPLFRSSLSWGVWTASSVYITGIISTKTVHGELRMR